MIARPSPIDFRPQTVLVANSAALHGRGMGAFIDGFANVVRFNDYAGGIPEGITIGPDSPRGREADFGRRTTHQVLTDTTAGAYDKRVSSHLWYDPFSRLDHNRLRDGDTILPGHLTALLRTYQRDDGAPDRADIVPSSGLAAAFHFILRHGPLYLAGFDGFRSPRSHDHRPDATTYHHWPSEQHLLRQLVANGLAAHL